MSDSKPSDETVRFIMARTGCKERRLEPLCDCAFVALDCEAFAAERVNREIERRQEAETALREIREKIAVHFGVVAPSRDHLAQTLNTVDLIALGVLENADPPQHLRGEVIGDG